MSCVSDGGDVPSTPSVFLCDPDVTLYHGDVLATLRELPAESVDCVVTSPPYWGLRDYGTGAWEGGDAGCDHKASNFDRGGVLLGHATGGASVNTAHARTTPYRDTCGKCGATRIDQQLGLEPTPEQYVERMVEVFREVRRVLASHGTVWLNLGDSFAASGYSNHANTGGAQREDGGKPRHLLGSGLKPKDLCMIPARLAMALQAPYYTGDIKKEADRAWLAAVVDSEGCIYISRSKKGATTGRDRKYQRTQDAFDVGLSVVNTARELLDRCVEITGIGTVRESHNRGTQAYEWRIYSGKARKVLRELYPHLVSKRQQARLALGCPPSGEQARKAWESLKALHQGQTASMDFAPPEGMWERGWFLRSEIIWAKCIPNPMPESVTDRPTKAHEQIFLLSKQPRYFFDQEAVRESHASDALERTLNPKHGFGSGEGNGAGRTMHAFGAHPSGRNIRSVWPIATQPYPEAHFATFPEELARRCIAAGCPEQVCRALVCKKCDLPHPTANVEWLWNAEAGRHEGLPEQDAIQEALRCVREALREQESLRVQSEMSWDSGDAESGHEAEGREDQPSGLHPPVDAGLPVGDDGEGLRAGTPLRDGATPGAEVGTAREGASPQRGSGGQPPLELGDSDALDAPWSGRVSDLRDALLRSLTCACGASGFRVCGKARERVVDLKASTEGREKWAGQQASKDGASRKGGFYDREAQTLGFTDCGHNDYRPGIVLDPFMGSGTVAYVARKLGRRSIGIDLSAEYLELAARRLQQQSLFAEAL